MVRSNQCNGNSLPFSEDLGSPARNPMASDAASRTSTCQILGVLLSYRDHLDVFTFSSVIPGLPHRSTSSRGCFLLRTNAK
jgi:hypothetical protein